MPKPVVGVTKQCETCGKPFHPHAGRVQSSKWCGRACFYKAHRVYRQCIRCGREFYHLKNRPRQKCSRDCQTQDLERLLETSPRHVSGNGYVYRYAPGHRSVQGKPYRYVAEHRLVMEQILGRDLASWENVHHRDGVRQNNDPANLELWVVNQPAGQASEYLNEIARLRLRVAELEAQLAAHT